MSEQETPEVGAIGWTDLTVSDAPRIRDFYREVVGWSFSEVPMEGYSDFNMNAPGSGRTAAGICHARGMNAGLPAQWLIYIVVADLDRSLARCAELGGQAIGPVRGTPGQGRYCVIRDPAGAVAALFEPKA